MMNRFLLGIAFIIILLLILFTLQIANKENREIEIEDPQRLIAQEEPNGSSFLLK